MSVNFDLICLTCCDTVLFLTEQWVGEHYKHHCLGPFHAACKDITAEKGKANCEINYNS